MIFSMKVQANSQAWYLTARVEISFVPWCNILQGFTWHVRNTQETSNFKKGTQELHESSSVKESKKVFLKAERYSDSLNLLTSFLNWSLMQKSQRRSSTYFERFFFMPDQHAPSSTTCSTILFGFQALKLLASILLIILNGKSQEIYFLLEDVSSQFSQVWVLWWI